MNRKFYSLMPILDRLEMPVVNYSKALVWSIESKSVYNGKLILMVRPPTDQEEIELHASLFINVLAKEPVRCNGYKRNLKVHMILGSLSVMTKY